MKKDIIKVNKLEIAIRAANKYSRRNINTSTTAMEYNEYNAEKRKDAHQRVDCVRNLIKNSIRDPLRIAPEAISLFLTSNKACKEYQAGNCSEFAQLAWHYLIKKLELKVRTELYAILGVKNEADGDHVFLVVNRNEKSVPYDPFTWGKDAYICDPWSNKVYPANKFKTKLKNYRCLKEKNYLEDFNSEKHILVGYNLFNSQVNSINKTKGIDDLIENYKTKLDYIKDCFGELKDNLELIAKDIQKKSGEVDPKYNEVVQRIKLLEDELKKIAGHIKTITPKENYHATRKWLRSQLKFHIIKLEVASSISDKAIETYFTIKPNKAKAPLQQFAHTYSANKDNQKSLTLFQKQSSTNKNYISSIINQLEEAYDDNVKNLELLGKMSFK